MAVAYYIDIQRRDSASCLGRHSSMRFYKCARVTVTYPKVVVVISFFFFSSRRRHTRCSRDWSSDVCSSDLTPVHRDARPVEADLPRERLDGRECGEHQAEAVTRRIRQRAVRTGGHEERRVGGNGRRACRGKGEESGGGGFLKKKKRTEGAAW